MKVEELIAHLQELPAGSDVVIYDEQRAELEGAKEPSSTGMYKNFDFYIKPADVEYNQKFPSVFCLRFQNEFLKEEQQGSKDAFEQLTLLQMDFGYGPGEINPVALFGLFGEAGEVLDEVILSSKGPDYKDERLRVMAVEVAAIIDEQKKRIRKNPEAVPDALITREDDGEAFDLEIADTLYYLNLLALNRGKTLADYAVLSVAKVKAKKMKPAN